MKTDNLQS